MKKEYLLFSIIGKLTLTFLIYLQITGCKKENAFDLPRVTTGGVTNITPLSATLHGSFVSKGTVFIGFRGVCWDTTPNPIMESNGPILNFFWAGWDPPLGDFSFDLTEFKPGTKYYVRSFVSYWHERISDTLYGNEVSFTTP